MEDIPDSPNSPRSGSGPSPRHSRTYSRNKSNISLSTNPKQVKNLVESMLKQATFVGQYIATQRVDSLGEYRNVIQIEENDSLIPIISRLQPRIIQAFPNCWPGITIPGNLSSQRGYCFWAEQCDKIFEPYQFRITDICFTPQEVCFVIQADCKLTTPMNEDIYDVLNASVGSIKKGSKKLALGAWNLLTKENVLNTFKFVVALLSLLGATAVYLLDYFIRLLDALTNLIKVSMPAILKILDIVKSISGAVMYFLAMIWKDLIGRTYYERPQRVHKPKYLKY